MNVLTKEKVRFQIRIRGAVQGVGFRPFVYRLAHEMGLPGQVSNTPDGILIDVEGEREVLEVFLSRLQEGKPVHSIIEGCFWEVKSARGYTSFKIVQSEEKGLKSVRVLNDLAICQDCMREVFDSTDRRYQYPFTNCTNCGPRFSIIEGLPYDRSRTTMKSFQMCPACEEEFHNPANRRFHAQPNACPDCGPQLALWDQSGKVLSTKDEALEEAAKAIREGQIVALKGLGGFHLLVDARNEAAVQRLREKKKRPRKPFAVMFPMLDYLRQECELSKVEKRLLVSHASPIVLLDRKKFFHREGAEDTPTGRICASVAPDNPTLGAMLPYSPLHAVLVRRLGFPVVATSGNLSDEPICIDEKEALTRLAGIADVFLVHNRPIVRAEDDSVMKIMLGKPVLIRAGRGHAPLARSLELRVRPGLAVGGHLKNTVAVTAGDRVILSQHNGDLDTKTSYEGFLKSKESLEALYEVKPRFVAADLHPDYYSTQFAEKVGVPVLRVQHHHAHVVSCMAENNLKNKVLGVAFDGLGYGSDGTLWGGEFLLSTRKTFQRIGHLRPFPLPGGEKSIKEPRRTAVGLLYAMFGEAIFNNEKLWSLKAFSHGELKVLQSMLKQNLNSPMTSSMGRLFDAVASLINLNQVMSFEGEAAMAMEFAAEEREFFQPYAFPLREHKKNFMVLDWEPMIKGILEDLEAGESVRTISTKFHCALVFGLVQVARKIGLKPVVLTGGCFQNKYLLEKAVQRLELEGFEPYWQQDVPPNDGGLALGQAIVASSNLNGK